jgi:hypothetical protein
MKYMVDYSVLLNEWGELEFNADNEDEAREIAIEHLEGLYPELESFEINEIKIIDA